MSEWQSEHERLDRATAVTSDSIHYHVHEPRHDGDVWMCEAWWCLDQRYYSHATGGTRELVVETATSRVVKMIEKHRATV